MKLRQKLAAALATAMVVTAVPVVTMATATTSTKREAITIKKGETFATIGTANAIKISFDNETIDADAEETVYLTFENAEWSNDAFNLAGNGMTQTKFSENGDLDTWTTTLTDSKGNAVAATFEKQDSKVMKVRLTGHKAESTLFIPLLATAKGGDAKVTVENKGNGTLSKTNSYIFATTGERKFTIAADTAKSFYREGELAKLTVTEAYPTSLKDGGKFRIELDNTDFQLTNQTVTAKGMYGFGGKPVTATLTVDSDDKSSATVTINGLEGDKTLGVIELTGIRVKSISKTPEEGDFLVDIKSVDESMSADMNNVVLGKVAKYSTYIQMKDEKVEDVKAGRIEEIEFEIGEGVEDSMISDREFEITLENGHFDYAGLVKAYYEEQATQYNEGKPVAQHKTALEMAQADYAKATFVPGKECKKTAAYIDAEWLAKKLLADKNDWNIGTGAGKTNIEFDVDVDGMVIPETLIVNLGEYKTKGALQTNKNTDKVKFKANVCVPVTNKEKEKVTITASGRALENEVSTTAINIINPFDVTYEQATLKVGLQNQVSGALKLDETDKEMLQKGDVTFAIKDANEANVGIYLTDVEFETSSSIKGQVEKADKVNKSATITLNRVTKEKGSIEFKNMKFTVDRTVPEGTYDLVISGKGIDADEHEIIVKDFIKITTANTQDITANGLAKGSSTFVIGESKYVFEGKEFTMDAPSYIQDPGYTMVPVRYVAQAFGVSEKDILFGNGTVTIFAGERTISLTNGSNNAVVNGNPVAMGTSVVIKEGRTYAPAGEIARLLGISTSWDATTKTATFTNK